jgi:hypothetical protein
MAATAIDGLSFIALTLAARVSVSSKRCAHDGCTQRPSFNAPDETKGAYCATHKLAGMVNVVSKRCAHDGCARQPSFNAPDQTRGAYCATHKLPGMIDVSNKRCAHDGCAKLNPIFNAPDQPRGFSGDGQRRGQAVRARRVRDESKLQCARPN